MVKLDLEKAEKTEIKLTTSVWSSKKEQNSRKASTPASLTTLKPLTVWFTTNHGKFLKWWEYQATLPAFWETCVQVKKQQLEPDIEYVNAVYCHPAYLPYTQYIVGNAGLEKAPAGIKIAMRNISNLRCSWHHPYGRKQRRTKEPLDGSESRELKCCLKTQHSEN